MFDRPTVTEELLFTLQNEPESFVARKIAHTVSEVAVSAVPNGEWDNLLDVVVSMSSSANPAHQPIGLYVIGKLAEYLSQVLLSERSF